MKQEKNHTPREPRRGGIQEVRITKYEVLSADKEELKFWISQNATSKSIKIGSRKSPRVFTEYGEAMVPSIINSQRAAEASVQIIQAFVFMKKAMMEGNLLSPHPSWWSGILQDIRHS